MKNLEGLFYPVINIHTNEPYGKKKIVAIKNLVNSKNVVAVLSDDTLVLVDENVTSDIIGIQFALSTVKDMGPVVAQPKESVKTVTPPVDEDEVEDYV